MDVLSPSSLQLNILASETTPTKNGAKRIVKVSKEEFEVNKMDQKKICQWKTKVDGENLRWFYLDTDEEVSPGKQAIDITRKNGFENYKLSPTRAVMTPPSSPVALKPHLEPCSDNPNVNKASLSPKLEPDVASLSDELRSAHISSVSDELRSAHICPPHDFTCSLHGDYIFCKKCGKINVPPKNGENGNQD